MIHDSENSFEVDRLIGKECKVPKNYILFIDILLISLYFFLHAHPPPPFSKKGEGTQIFTSEKSHPPQRMQRAWHNYNHVFHII